MKNFGLTLCILFLLGCSRGKEQVVTIEKAPEETAEIVLADYSVSTIQDVQTPAISVQFAQLVPEPLLNAPRFVLGNTSARPGETVTIGCSSPAEQQKLRAVLLDSRGRRIAQAAFISLESNFQGTALKAAILPIPSTALIGEALVRIESEDGVIRDLTFVIDSREFHSETIALNQANTDLRTVPDPQKTAESELLWTIISRTGTEIYSMEAFLPPVNSTRRTSSYGSRRVYQYADGKSDTTIHAGIDYGVPTGTDVLSCAAGRVVLARERIVTGNTVILEHLPGVYSLYYHMDSIHVSEGAIVEKASLLGKSGSTGLATGPHLHWEIRVFTENTDPDTFLSRPVLDKNDITTKLGFGNME